MFFPYYPIPCLLIEPGPLILKKITVIVPVFNVEKYLRSCLDSILSQTMTEMEIILIDDCSTDGSTEILKEYIKEFPELVMVRNEQNSGLSFCRNLGISLAQAPYLCFIDSDDTIEPSMFEDMVKLSLQNSLDILMSNYKYIFSDGKCMEFFREEVIYNAGVQEGIGFLKESLKWHCLPSGGNCSNIYRTSFIRENEILYTPGTYFEDVKFQLDSLIAAKRVACVHKSYYHYFKRESSITGMFSEKKVSDHFDISEAIYSRYHRMKFLNPLFYELFYMSIFNAPYNEYQQLIDARVKENKTLLKLLRLSTSFKQSAISLCLLVLGVRTINLLRQKYIDKHV